MVSAMNLHPLTPEQKNEYTRIAYYYYEAGRTQDQIAQRLGISRQRVNRILAECIERGIVRITVDRSPEEYFASESALEEKYRLKAVRLAHSLGADQLYGDLGVVAGQYLKSIVKRGDIIGCVPGRGVAGLVDNMPQMERTGLRESSPPCRSRCMRPCWSAMPSCANPLSASPIIRRPTPL